MTLGEKDMKRFAALLLLLASCAFASEEESARNREIRVTPGKYSITADYPAPYGRTTVTATTSSTDGITRIQSIVFASASATIEIPAAYTQDIFNPQTENITLTYSASRRTDEGIHASVTVPWGESFTNSTHLYQRRAFGIVGNRLAYIINKRPKDDWYETEFQKIEDTQQSLAPYGAQRGADKPN